MSHVPQPEKQKPKYEPKNQKIEHFFTKMIQKMGWLIQKMESSNRRKCLTMLLLAKQGHTDKIAFLSQKNIPSVCVSVCEHYTIHMCMCV